MKRLLEESLLSSSEIGSVDELMLAILKASVPKLKFYTWQDCRRLVERRLVSKKYRLFVDQVFRSLQRLSRELTKEWTYPELIELEGLEKLRVEENRDGFMFIPPSTNLKELCVYQDIDDRHIQPLTSLEKFYLYDASSVTDKSLLSLPNLTKLRCSPATKITLNGLLACTKLKSLRLSCWFGEMSELSRLKQLKSLSVKYSPVGLSTELPLWNQLSKLNIRGVPINIATLSRNLTNLTSLSCSYGHLALMNKRLKMNLVKLKVTTLTNTKLLSEFTSLRLLKVRGFFVFRSEHFSKLTNLTSLQLDRIQRYTHSEEFPDLPNLKSLSHHCHGCDFDEFDFSKLTSLTKLTYHCPWAHTDFFQMTSLRKINIPLVDDLDYSLARKSPSCKICLHYRRCLTKEERDKIIKSGFILKYFHQTG